jgi:hypothetical protein
MSSEITTKSTKNEVLLSSLLNELFRNIDDLPFPNNGNSYTNLNKEVLEGSKMTSKQLIIYILKLITSLCNNYLDLMYSSKDNSYDSFLYNNKGILNKLTIDTCSGSKNIFLFYKLVCARSLYNEYNKYELKSYICEWFKQFAKNSRIHDQTRVVNIINKFIQEIEKVQRLKDDDKLQRLKDEENKKLSESLNKLLENIDNLPIKNVDGHLTTLQDSKESQILLILILKMLTYKACDRCLDLIYNNNGYHKDYDKFYFYQSGISHIEHMNIIDGCDKTKPRNMKLFLSDDQHVELYIESRELFNFYNKCLDTILYEENNKYELKRDILNKFLEFAESIENKIELVNIIKEFRKGNKPNTRQRSRSPNKPNTGKKSSTGGKTIKINKTKLLFGKERCIYKKSGDQKEYIKYKGDLITVREYKIIIRNKK